MLCEVRLGKEGVALCDVGSQEGRLRLPLSLACAFPFLPWSYPLSSYSALWLMDHLSIGCLGYCCLDFSVVGISRYNLSVGFNTRGVMKLTEVKGTTVPINFS